MTDTIAYQGYIPGTPLPDVETTNVTVVHHNTDVNTIDKPLNIVSQTGQSRAKEAWTLPAGDAGSAAYSWPDSPDEDVLDNPKANEKTYQMTQALQPIPGYENTKVRKGKPHTKPNALFLKGRSQTFEKLPVPLSKTDAQDALKEHVSHKCCYGKRAAADIEVDNVINYPIHKYKLRTFTETRETIRVYEPFQGQTMDTIGKTPPPIWEVTNNPDVQWKKQSKTCVVPNTSTIETCHGCTGRGFNQCYRCRGRGTILCTKCKGDGKIKETVCVACAGSGHPRCQLCRGHACIPCSVCQGNRQLYFYINLISTFDIIEDEVWLNQTKVPNKNLKTVHKIQVIESETTMVAPITNYSIEEVNTESQELLSKHSEDSTKRIILQFHVLFGLPAVEAQYEWKSKTKSFWVYGEDNRVYASDYPEPCCGSACTII